MAPSTLWLTLQQSLELGPLRLDGAGQGVHLRLQFGNTVLSADRGNVIEERAVGETCGELEPRRRGGFAGSSAIELLEQVHQQVVGLRGLCQAADRRRR